MASAPPQPRGQPEFWRIRGIDISEREDTTEWLRDQVKRIEISEGLGFSLAADSERTLCATVTSFERPSPPKRRWHVDKHFVGFTPLHEPENATVDVVAITGLGGHALASFRCGDGTSVWLRDFAPHNVPQARFIAYGYDSVMAASDSSQSIRELAHTFLDGLALFRRRTQTTDRPLCFVGHSLGGLVLKEALVMSNKAAAASQRGLGQIEAATYGLLLPGVPNLGLRPAQLYAVVKGQANAMLLNDVLTLSDGEPPQYLKHLRREFLNLDRRRQLPFYIVSYYETKFSHATTCTDQNGLELLGQEIIVTKFSAGNPGHFAQDFDHLPSHSDHQGLVRFTHSQDDRFQSMIGKIASMVTQASQLRRSTEAAVSENSSVSITSILEQRAQSIHRRGQAVGVPPPASFPADHAASAIAELTSTSFGIGDGRPTATNASSASPGQFVQAFLNALAPDKAWQTLSALPTGYSAVPTCFVLYTLAFLVIGISLAIGLYYSIVEDRMGDGFTAAGWLTGAGTIVLAGPMAKHYPKCNCWKDSRNRLLP